MTHGADAFEPANAFKIGCESLANDIVDLLYIAIACHIICGVLNVYREIFETKLGTIGQIMRAMEILCIASSMILIISAVRIYFLYWSIEDNRDRHTLRQCLANVEMM